MTGFVIQGHKNNIYFKEKKPLRYSDLFPKTIIK